MTDPALESTQRDGHGTNVALHVVAGERSNGAVRDERTTVESVLAGAVNWLKRRQGSDGSWVGVVDSNACISAEWLLAGHILGLELPMQAGLVRWLLERQRSDGSWEIYPGAPHGDINSTVEVYAALRAVGLAPEDAAMSRAREWILANGGLRDVRVFTRYWLAMIGAWPWRATPNLPPEIIHFKPWFPFSIYNFAQWARATMVPLAVLSARRPVRPLHDGPVLEELFVAGRDAFDFDIPPKRVGFFSLENAFAVVDRILHRIQDGPMPLRELSIKLCLEWIIRHQDADGAWGGIQPPWIYGLLALHGEGYPLDHPVLKKGISALSDHWSYETGQSVHIQATDSSVWDTLFGLFALHEAGHVVENTPAMRRALEYLLDHQILVRGDWSLRNRDLEPGGWAFERANNFYPDVDDSAMALLVLSKIRYTCGDLRDRVAMAIDRGVAWVIGMQSSNGGWAAFDRDNNKEIISKIPFCNFGEALDPPSIDVTAHVLEALGSLGMSPDHPAIRSARAFIDREQEADGSWFGRWGVNYIYGIAAVLPALRELGEDLTGPRVRSAVQWLLVRQNADGGWGEGCESYMVYASRGRGPSTASQTSWAMMALIAAGGDEVVAAVRRGREYLCKTQTADGTWEESAYTGTGFPGYGIGARVNLNEPNLHARLGQGAELSRGFMIRYDLYRHYFPIIAIARSRSLG
jgi:squalene-hopene/tetraprenyl-beta-curcumene cyclase